MIDTDTESPVHFTEAAALFPGRKPCIQTLHRWRMKGVRVEGSKDRVLLETIKIAGLRYTTKEAVARFIAAQNPQPKAAKETDAARARRSEAARLELEKLGIRTRAPK